MKAYLTLSLIALVLPAIASAAAFESLGEPCRGFNVLASRVVKDPAGKEWFVLSNSNETSGVELIFIDFQNNTAKKYPAPAGQGAWMLNPAPGDRLIVGTYYDGKMMVFDLKTMSFTKVISLPGETYFWNAAIGSDGRLYGGTYPGAKLAALDLDTLALEDCGAPAAPNLYCRNISPTPDGRILANFVTEKQTTKLFDPKTKKWSDVPPSIKNVQRATVWNDLLLSGASWDGGKSTGGAIAFKGDDFQPIDPPPFPLPPSKGDWTVDLVLTTPKTLYLRQGPAIYRLESGDKELTKVFEQDLKSGAITAIAPDGTLLGIRGQDYVIAKPGETTARLVPIPVEAGPRPVHFIKPDNAGRLWGGPMFGQTLFWLDLLTGQSVNTGIVANAGGEVYDVAFQNGKVYAVAYVGGDIIEFDPLQPWDQIAGKNPRNLAHLTSKGYIRPVAGVRIGPDGKLYSGWMAKYGSYGGAIAITDPKTGATELIENPLGQQAISAMAMDDTFIYAGTELHGNGLPNKPGEQPQFGMIDRVSRKVAFQKPLEGAGVSKILYDAKTRLAIVLYDRKIHFFDPAKREFIASPVEMPAVNAQAIDGTGDGTIFFASDNAVIAYDLSTHQMRRNEAPAKVEHLAVGADHTIFFNCGPTVYRMKQEQLHD